jgi:hypothetical protein
MLLSEMATLETTLPPELVGQPFGALVPVYRLGSHIRRRSQLAATILLMLTIRCCSGLLHNPRKLSLLTKLRGSPGAMLIKFIDITPKFLGFSLGSER